MTNPSGTESKAVKLAIIYYSTYGTNHAMANEAAGAARAAGATHAAAGTAGGDLGLGRACHQEQPEQHEGPTGPGDVAGACNQISHRNHERFGRRRRRTISRVTSVGQTGETSFHAQPGHVVPGSSRYGEANAY